MTHPATGWPVRSTSALCAAAEVSEDATALLATALLATAPVEPPQRVFVGSLVERELFADAIAFLAHALPRREAVWWAWVCARKASGQTPPPKIQAALDATERWIVQPTEDNRRQAMLYGELADFGTPAGCAALGAFFSGGSLSPADAPPVPPGEFMTAKAVAGSVTMAAVSAEPEKAPEKFQEYVRLALEVADRTKLWPAA
jgi:hypothetical protein